MLITGWRDWISSADHEAQSNRSSFGVSGLLLWSGRTRAARSAGRMVKQEWRKRCLLKRVQLTISGCLGPCDVPNVVAIVTQTNTLWLGSITRQDQYQSLLDWASRSKDLGRADIPSELLVHLLEDPVSL
jgi:hypothetical protein